MSNLLLLPTASAPPATAAPQAASPARETSETQGGSTFKKALAAAQKSDAEKPADPALQSEPSAKSVETPSAEETDEATPLRQALLAAMAALASSAAAPVQPVIVAASEAEPTATPQAADAAAALTLQAEVAAAADDSAQPDAATQTDAAQAAKSAQFSDLLKAQAKPEAEAKPEAQAKVAREAAPAAAQPLITVMDGNKVAAAKSALEAFADQLKPEVEKPPAVAEKLVAQPLDLGQVKAATTFNVNELARLSEARPNSPLPMVAQIQQGVETLTKSGQTSLRLQLNPEALGRVDLRLTTSANGVHVSLTADLSATGNLLERHAQELRQALSDSGLTVAGLSIGFNLGQGKSSTAFEWQPPASGRGSTAGLGSALETELDPIAPLRTLDAGRVDYRI